MDSNRADKMPLAERPILQSITECAVIIPCAQIAELAEAPAETLQEMSLPARQFQQALKDVYHPERYSLGLNVGRCAGGDVEYHLHLQVLPRWTGDSYFTTVEGETRVEPEDLTTTSDKLVGDFRT